MYVHCTEVVTLHREREKWPVETKTSSVLAKHTIAGDINAKVGEENLDYDKLSGRSREGARGARPQSPPPPLFLHQTEPRRAEKNCF